mmetsp:Transcript_13888/g.35449  ORF Transcript_13888/g.35449 Transcript_13888/m.35449 type:complete len:343 (+) Transcript_13888:461-1489(+)
MPHEALSGLLGPHGGPHPRRHRDLHPLLGLRIVARLRAQHPGLQPGVALRNLLEGPIRQLRRRHPRRPGRRLLCAALRQGRPLRPLRRRPRRPLRHHRPHVDRKHRQLQGLRLGRLQGRVGRMHGEPQDPPRRAHPELLRGRHVRLRLHLDTRAAKGAGRRRRRGDPARRDFLDVYGGVHDRKQPVHLHRRLRAAHQRDALRLPARDLRVSASHLLDQRLGDVLRLRRLRAAVRHLLSRDGHDPREVCARVDALRDHEFLPDPAELHRRRAALQQPHHPGRHDAMRRPAGHRHRGTALAARRGTRGAGGSGESPGSPAAGTRDAGRREDMKRKRSVMWVCER